MRNEDDFYCLILRNNNVWDYSFRKYSRNINFLFYDTNNKFIIETNWNDRITKILSAHFGRTIS